MQKPYLIHVKQYKIIYGSVWAHMGPYGWPEVNKNNVNNVKIIIRDSDFLSRFMFGGSMTS